MGSIQELEMGLFGQTVGKREEGRALAWPYLFKGRLESDK